MNPGPTDKPGYSKLCVDDTLQKPLSHFLQPSLSADLCPDSWTDRKTEKECKEDGECVQFNIENNGKCLGDPLGVDTKTHCCPKVDVSGTDRSVLNPYRLAKKCTQLQDCIGERRFCDPLTGQCMYHGSEFEERVEYKGKYSALHMRPNTEKTCTVKDMICGNDKRIICMKVEAAEPICYAHPLDECDKNSECGQTKYCAPQEGTKDEDFDTAFRKCHERKVLESFS